MISTLRGSPFKRGPERDPRSGDERRGDESEDDIQLVPYLPILELPGQERIGGVGRDHRHDGDPAQQIDGTAASRRPGRLLRGPRGATWGGEGFHIICLSAALISVSTFSSAAGPPFRAPRIAFSASERL